MIEIMVEEEKRVFRGSWTEISLYESLVVVRTLYLRERAELVIYAFIDFKPV